MCVSPVAARAETMGRCRPGRRPPRFLGALEATPATSEMLDALPARRDTWRKLTLTAGAANLVGDAHVDRSGKTCLTLFTSLDNEM